MAVAKKTAKKKTTVRTKAPAKKAVVKTMAKNTEKKGAKVDETRIWGSTAQVLKWLDEDGLKLSQKNLYEHYGPSSKAPCPKRPKDGKWDYRVLIEQVRLNRDKNSNIDYSQVNKLGLAIKAAELKKKSADADKAQMTARKMAGELIERDAVVMVLRKAALDIETLRKKLVADLQHDLKLKPADVKKVEERSKNWLAGLGERFLQMEV